MLRRWGCGDDCFVTRWQFARYRAACKTPCRDSRGDCYVNPLAPQLPQQPRLDPGGDLYATVHLRFLQHFGVPVQRSEQFPLPHGHTDRRDGAERLGGGAENRPQPVDPARLRIADCGLRNGRGEYRVRILLSDLGEKPIRIRQQVGLSSVANSRSSTKMSSPDRAGRTLDLPALV